MVDVPFVLLDEVSASGELFGFEICVRREVLRKS